MNDVFLKIFDVLDGVFNDFLIVVSFLLGLFSLSHQKLCLIVIESKLFFVLDFLLFVNLELNFVLFDIINQKRLIALKFNDLFFVIKLSLVSNFNVAGDLLDFNFVDVDFLFSFCQFELTFAFV